MEKGELEVWNFHQLHINFWVSTDKLLPILFKGQASIYRILAKEDLRPLRKVLLLDHGKLSVCLDMLD